LGTKSGNYGQDSNAFTLTFSRVPKKLIRANLPIIYVTPK